MFWIPPAQPNWSMRSGTPETLAVNAMVPLATAAKGRPDGDRVTSSVSTMSTYISLLVCLTFALLHGTGEAVWLEFGDGPNFGLALPPPRPNAPVDEGARELGVEDGNPTPPRRLLSRFGASTTSLSAFGSVFAMMPPSTISLSSCATTS